MKRLGFFGGIVTLCVAMAMFVACREDVRPEPEQKPDEVTMVDISITVDDDTRTILDKGEKRAVWSVEDRLMVIESGERYAETTKTTILEDGKAQFSVAFERDTTADAFTYDAIYPAQSVSFDEGVYNELVKVTLPAEQHPTAESFDPMADILVAEHREYDAQPMELSMRFKRLVALGAMELRSIPEDETIIEVDITAIAEGGKQSPLAGCNLVNCIEGAVFEYGYEDASSTIALIYDNPVPAATTIYLMCNPMELTEGDRMTVRVVTDKATYTRTMELTAEHPLILSQGDMNTFTIDMGEAKVEEHKLCFKRATSVKAGGVYLLAAEGYIATPITENYGYIQVAEGDTDGDGIILQESLDNAYILEAVSGGYAIKQCYDDRYLYMYKNYTSFNMADGATDGYEWSITPEGDGTFTITNTLKNKFIQYSVGYTSFGCYSSAQDDGVMPMLYELTSDVALPPAEEPTPKLSELYVQWDGEMASCGCVVENPEYIVGDVHFSFESDDAANVEVTYDVEGVQTYAYVEGIELQTDESYTLTAWCESASGVRVVSESATLFTATSSGDIVASGSWLELPAQRTDGKYPKAKEYKVMSGSERNYTHYYDTNTYTTLWVAYPIEAKHMGSIGRPDNWSFHPDIPEKDQVNLCSHSYSNTYVRGHLIPNASRNGIRDMQLQTFYVTNSVPQIHANFNSGIWQKLEAAIQSIGERETVYVVTGVAFEKMGETKTINYTTAKDDTKRVPVPNYFYKVVLKVNTNSSGEVTAASTIGFWFENKAYSDNAYSDHAVSVDEIEQWTGFDYFVNLPDSIESVAERNSSWSTFSSF